MRHHKSPKQLKKWRQKEWKPIGCRDLSPYKLFGLPVYVDDQEGIQLCVTLSSSSGPEWYERAQRWRKAQ